MPNPEFCFSANPDISGIGVRVAIYVQNLLITASTVCVLLDKKVMRTEFKVMEAQSTTMIITGSALLISTIVQFFTRGLSNLHAAIILNLCGMNNSNLVMYFSLYLYHLFEGDNSGEVSEGSSSHNLSVGKEIRALLRNPVFWFGTVQLTMTSAFGIWLWYRPLYFGSSPLCSQSAKIIILGIQVPFTSKTYRAFIITTSIPGLIPVLNTIMVGFFAIMLSSSFYGINKITGWGFGNFAYSLAFGLFFQGMVSIVTIVQTELTLGVNRSLMEKGDGDWTFGQTLALAMLLIPLWSVGQIILAHFQELPPPLVPPISPPSGQIDPRAKE